MKKNSLLWITGMFICLAGIFQSYGQISYYEDFGSEDLTWDDGGYMFWQDDYLSCNGQSWVTELYYYYDDVQSVSGSIGASDGNEATLTYSYKLTDYWSDEALPNTPEWGSITVSYATSPTGPWTVIDEITPDNHTPSDQCVVRSATFTPPNGNEIYLSINTQNPVDEDVDALFYIDDLYVVQGNCNGTPAAAATISSLDEACLNSSFTLSLSSNYIFPGITYQWQASTNGTTFTNVAEGGNLATYTTTEPETMWYRAIVTCTESAESITSTPVEVTSTGDICLCDIEFYEAVEPITLVNFAGINNTSADDAETGREDFTSLDAAQVVKGETYTLTLKGNTEGFYESYFTLFIDFNHDGNFTEGESFEAGSVFFSTGTDDEEAVTEITIPAGALTGLTYMRVLKLDGSYSSDPCSSVDGDGYGQAEDYMINISCPEIDTTELDENLVFCEGATGANLPSFGGTVAWYASETAPETIADTEVLTETTYYATKTEADCVSERVAVTVMIDEINLDVQDVAACGSYTLPELESGNYYTAAGATGDMLAGGDVVTASMTIYVYVETAEGCVADESFAVEINAVPEISGATTQEFTEGQTLADLNVNGDNIVWYADAEMTQLLETTAVLTDDATYYAVATNGGCVSNALAVTVNQVLSAKAFTLDTLSFYPNPVTETLNLSYGAAITSVAVYNIVGQQVVFTTVNANQAQINMSALAAGTYMVKVTAGDAVRVIKVMKN
ncbi:T9SS type A sorting domain-containing protein [Flavobacterium rhizosphaerae]|uniref:T9SS type A sorting domain-containing protein n=1 Tax=Flavobacterium rhizosphaerae TaxID=3163298 RepID=A0ABW8Z0F1_9FLAO